MSPFLSIQTHECFVSIWNLLSLKSVISYSLIYFLFQNSNIFFDLRKYKFALPLGLTCLCKFNLWHFYISAGINTILLGNLIGSRKDISCRTTRKRMRTTDIKYNLFICSYKNEMLYILHIFAVYV